MENCFWLNTLVPLFFIRYFTMSNHSMVLIFRTHKLKNLPLQLSFCILKRELETIFVHTSNATMPAFNIFKNSGHYWILSGFNLAYFIYGPSDKLGF